MDFNLTLIGQTIAMIVFVWFCMKFIWPPLVQAIEDRRSSIADGIAAGEQGQKDLQAAQVQAESVLDEARGRAVKIVDDANSRYNEILTEAKQDAQKERTRQVEAGRAEIEQEINKARDELRAQVSGIAMASAERILRREIDANTHRDLLDQLARQL